MKRKRENRRSGWKQAFIYIFAFLFPPLVSIVLTVTASVSRVMIHGTPKPLPAEAKSQESPKVKPLARGRHKLNAVVLLSNAGTELMEFLGPTEILGQSGRFEISTAAPLKQLSATTGPLAVMPDRMLSEIPDSERIDLLVIPAVLDPENTTLTSWIAKRAPTARMVLICGDGAKLAAQAGILDDKAATSHFIGIRELKTTYPRVHWFSESRYLRDGNVITTAGLLATLDGTLGAIEALLGQRVAIPTARALHYDWNRSENPMRASSLTSSDYLMLLVGAYRWNRHSVGVLLFPGISEIALAAETEFYLRTLSTDVRTLAPERNIIRTRFGISLVPEDSISQKDSPEILLMASAKASEDELVQKWIREQHTIVKSSDSHAGPAIEQSLLWVSESEGKALSAVSAKMLGYAGSIELQPKDRRIPLTVWIKLLGLGATGVVLASVITRRFAI